MSDEQHDIAEIDDWRDWDGGEDDHDVDMTCPECGGTGYIWDGPEPCDYCDGEGYLWWL